MELIDGPGLLEWFLASLVILVNPSNGRNDYRYYCYRHRDDSDFALFGALPYVVPIPDPFGQVIFLS